MARREENQPVRLSILDRLIDRDPFNTKEVPLTRSQSIRELRAGIRRDLEFLLNSRRLTPGGDDTVGGIEDSNSETYHSVHNYGLPDVSNLSMDSTRDQDKLVHLLEDAVAIFEPRLENVEITRHEAGKFNRNLRFTVEGLLQMDPSPIHISFDTFLELTNGEYSVRGE